MNEQSPVSEPGHATNLNLNNSSILIGLTDLPGIFTASDHITGEIIGATQQFFRDSGIDPAEAAGKTLAEAGWITEDDFKRIRESFTSEGQVQDLILTTCNRSEDYMTYTCNVSTITYRQRTCDLIQWVNITALLKAKEAHRRSDMLFRQSQMNPHFIFNALNSIQSYILSSNTEKASYYLNKFSRLLRLTMDYAIMPSVSLIDELFYIDSYIEIEKDRFEGLFVQHLNVDPLVDLANHCVPPLMLQPLVAHTIRQGMLESDQKGLLVIHLMYADSTLLRARIDYHPAAIGDLSESDVRSNRIKLSNTMQILEERIRIYNDEAGTALFHVELIDLVDQSGTIRGARAVIEMPCKEEF